jgi:hypothetical protein
MKRNEAKKNQDKINLGVLSILLFSPHHGILSSPRKIYP